MILGSSFPGGTDSKESACHVGGKGLIPGSGRFPWSRKQQPAPIFLPGKFHGQRSLAGYSSWGRKESDMTDPVRTRAHTHMHSHMHMHTHTHTHTSCSHHQGYLAIRAATPLAEVSLTLLKYEIQKTFPLDFLLAWEWKKSVSLSWLGNKGGEVEFMVFFF